ncbi:hypothetical protein P7K49_002574 [Saguinus oedipus]|uniref:Uncharacterized protein n=1 Tax=Saguinus oedipus TaxID=9490 RepID=A0ABQ9WHQ1_SAGOE|nr:hypothetical protein P7K49_002574 [Saguinus oedipus]
MFIRTRCYGDCLTRPSSMEAMMGHLWEETSDEVNQDQILWRLPDQTKQHGGHDQAAWRPRPSSMEAMIGHLREKVTSDEVNQDQILWRLPDQTKQHEGHGGSPEGEGDVR